MNTNTAMHHGPDPGAGERQPGVGPRVGGYRAGRRGLVRTFYRNCFMRFARGAVHPQLPAPTRSGPRADSFSRRLR